jgi:hypothetical protein
VTLAFTAFLFQVLGIVHLTLAQLVLLRVSFGEAQPGELTDRERELCRELFGDLPDEIPARVRRVVGWLKGARIGGTWFWALRLLYRALTANLDCLAIGEEGFCVAVCPDLRLSQQVIRYCSGSAHAVPAIAALIIAETATSISLRRPDGRVVTIEALPASQGGRAVRGRTIIEAVLDEACFFRDPDSGVVNDSENFRPIVARLVPDGTIGVISTAWSTAGLLMSLIDANHGKPTTALVAICPTLTMRDDQHIREIVESEMQRDPQNALRENFCKPLAASGSEFFDGEAVDAGKDSDRALVLPATFGWRYTAGADFAFTHDASALVIIGLDPEGVMHVCNVREHSPRDGIVLSPSFVLRDFASALGDYSLRWVMVDGWSLVPLQELASRSSVRLVEGPGGTTGKVDTYTECRTILYEGRLRYPDHARLVEQLKAIVAKPTPGGTLSITSPRTRSGHGDLVSALVFGVHAMIVGMSQLAAAKRQIARREHGLDYLAELEDPKHIPLRYQARPGWLCDGRLDPEWMKLQHERNEADRSGAIMAKKIMQALAKAKQN